MGGNFQPCKPCERFISYSFRGRGSSSASWPPIGVRSASDLLHGLLECMYKGVCGDDAERRMVRPKEHFDGIDLPLCLRDADGSDSVHELKDHRIEQGKVRTLRSERQLIPGTRRDAHLLARAAAATKVRRVKVHDPAPPL